MDALELLQQDHDTARSLFEQFKTAKENDDTEAMEALAMEIFHELDVHTAIEEEVFYPAVRDAGGDELNDTTDESVEEHHVVDVLMKELRSLTAEDDRFAAKMTVLIENVEHHASEEEDEMFPQVRRLMSQERLDQLGDELQAAKLKHRSKDDLYERAQQLGIDGRSEMTKQELTEAIGRAESAEPSPVSTG